MLICWHVQSSLDLFAPVQLEPYEFVITIEITLQLAGASIPPETMMHFPPLFQISPLF